MMSITEEQLLAVFAAYNEQIWPMQLVAYLLGFLGLFLAVRPTLFSSRLVPAILAFFWLWVAVFFWLPGARQGFVPGYLLAAVFATQGSLFLATALRSKLAFGSQANLTSWTGILIALYAMVGYPAAGLMANHIYPQAPPFGLTPCPLVTYTFGLLLLTQAKVPRILLILPLLYAISGLYWSTIGMVEDAGMALSGLLGVWLIRVRESKRAAVQPSDFSSEPSDAGWSLDIPDKH
jgi:hypothetical protein